MASATGCLRVHPSARIVRPPSSLRPDTDARLQTAVWSDLPVHRPTVRPRLSTDDKERVRVLHPRRAGRLHLGENDVEVFDIRFCDLLGIMNHLAVPASTVTVDSLAGGMAFDGSSIKGFQSIHESDMTLLPDVTTARIDTFRRRKTLTCNFFVHDPLTLQPYSRDPRNVARKAEEYLASTGIADTCYFGAEAEFYIFDNVQFGTSMTGSFYKIDSEEGWWNTSREEEGGNLGYKVRTKGGYFPVPPYDHAGRPARRHDGQPDRCRLRDRARPP